MVVDDVLAEPLDPGGHRAGEPVDGRLGAARLPEGLGVHGCDRSSVEGHVEGPQPLDQGGRPPEGPLHGHLLVQQHADQ